MERFRNPRNSLDKLESSEDNTLDRVEHLCPLDNGCHITTSTCNIGALDRLVLELILMTLVQLDIRSLTDFRRVNRRAMQVVDLISPYKKIITQAPIAIRVILSIGAGRWITCLDLYNKLRTQKCEVCGDSGGYLYLITCRRVCFRCFTTKAEFLPLLPREAKENFALCKRDLATLPSIRSIPGRYSPADSSRQIKFSA